MVSPNAASPWKRIGAAIIDTIIAAIPAMIIGIPMAFIHPAFGSLLIGLIWVGLFGFRDAFPIGALGGASIGKKLLGLQALRSDGTACDFEASIKRNAPLLVGSIVGIFASLISLVGIPFVGGILNIIGGIAGLIILIVETFKIFSDERGLRIGDLFASTYVTETNESRTADPAYQQQPPPPPGDSEPPPPPPA